MIIIRNISHDIKEKIKDADRDIRKAIEFKHEHPSIANNYYEFSIERTNEALNLHEELVEIISGYRKTNGEPSSVMQELWNFEHKLIMEDMENLKILQEYYKSL